MKTITPRWFSLCVIVLFLFSSVVGCEEKQIKIATATGASIELVGTTLTFFPDPSGATQIVGATLMIVGTAVTVTALTIDAYGYEEEQTWSIELTPEQIGQIRSIEMEGGEVATLKSQIVTGSVFSYNLGNWEQKQPASNE